MPNGGTKRDHDAAAAAARRMSHVERDRDREREVTVEQMAVETAEVAAEVASAAAAPMPIEERRARIINLLLSFMDTRPGAFTLNRATLVQDLTVVADRIIDIVEGRVVAP